MIILPTLLTLLSTYILWYLIKLTLWAIRAANMTANIPGPKAWPIVGSALLMLNIKSQKEAFEWVEKHVQEYSTSDKIGKFWLGPKLVIILANPEHIKIMLSSEDALEKDHFYKYLQIIAKGAVFSIGGKEWEELRKPVNKLTARRNVESNIEMFHQKALVLCEVLSKYAGSGQVFDLKHHVFNYVLDTQCLSSFGYDLNELQRDELNLGETMNRSVEIVYEICFASPHNLCLPFAKVSPAGRELKKCAKVFWDLSNKMLQNRIANKAVPGGMEEKKTLFVDFIEEQAKRDKLSLKESGKLGTEILFAGGDTLGLMISNTLLILAMHPEHQEAVYKEQVDILGEDATVGPNWEQLSRMTYLTRVLKEVMRLHGPFFIIRKATADIDLGDYKVPKGSTLFTLLYSARRDPRFWSHPEEFYPDHFLPEEVAGRPEGSYLPFSYGPRGCPGNIYAMAQMRIALSTIIRKYKFETDLKYKELTLKVAPFLEIYEGCFVRIKPRNI